MPIDPTIALGFRSPMGPSASSAQTSAITNLTQLMGLRDLVTRLRGAQSLGGFMTGGTAPSAAAPPVAAQAPWSGPSLPGPSTPPTTQLPMTGTGSLMTGLSRYGENVFSTDGGKTWLSGQTGQPVTGDIYQQTVI